MLGLQGGIQKLCLSLKRWVLFYRWTLNYSSFDSLFCFVCSQYLEGLAELGKGNIFWMGKGSLLPVRGGGAFLPATMADYTNMNKLSLNITICNHNQRNLWFSSESLKCQH